MKRPVDFHCRPRRPVGLGVALCFLLWVAAGASATPCLAEGREPDAITGTWVVEEKDAHVEIYKHDDRYFGRLSWLKDAGEEKPAEKREPKMHETPKVGMVIVRDFRFNGRDWRGGTLYDPTDGKSYKGIIRLDGKEQLHVRGYLGISLLGRTTVWQRLR